MEQSAIVDAVRNSTEELFSTMLGLKVAMGEPFVEKTPQGPSAGMVSMVGLAGTWIGTGSICCSGDFARRVAGAFLMSEFDSISDDVLDAMAECTNMIIGNFKTIAERHLGPLGLSLPTVIFGLNFTARSAGKERWTVIPFECCGETFEVKIFLTPNRGLSHLKLTPTGEVQGVGTATP